MTRGRILYVEDNVENRKLVKRILEAEGYEVVEAENGVIGVEKAKAANPDLILMDINLPDLDGYDCTARLRQIDGVGSIPIVALTANVMEGDRQKALDAGCDGYIPKPIDVDHLTQQVAHFIHKESERKVVPSMAELPQPRPAVPASVPSRSNGPIPAPVVSPPLAGSSSKPVPPPPALPSKPLPPPPPGFKIPPSIKNAPPPPPVRTPAPAAPTPLNASTPSAQAASATSPATTPAPAPPAGSNPGSSASPTEQPTPPAAAPSTASNAPSDAARETTGPASEPAGQTE